MKIIVFLLGMVLVFSSPMTGYADEWGGSDTEMDDLDKPIDEDGELEKKAEPPKKEVKQAKRKVRKAKKKKKTWKKKIHKKKKNIEDDI